LADHEKRMLRVDVVQVKKQGSYQGIGFSYAKNIYIDRL